MPRNANDLLQEIARRNQADLTEDRSGSQLPFDNLAAETVDGIIEAMPSDFVYGKSDDFRRTLYRWYVDGEGALNEDQKRAVKAAQDYGYVPSSRILTPDLAQLWQRVLRADSQEQRDSLMSEYQRVFPQPDSTKLWDQVKGFAATVDQGLSSIFQLGGQADHYYQSLRKSFPSLPEANLKMHPTKLVNQLFASAGLVPVPDGKSLFDKDVLESKRGEMRNAAEMLKWVGDATGWEHMGEAATWLHNAAIELITFAPQVAAGAIENPYEFGKGVVQFPWHETKKLAGAAFHIATGIYDGLPNNSPEKQVLAAAMGFPPWLPIQEGADKVVAKHLEGADKVVAKHLKGTLLDVDPAAAYQELRSHPMGPIFAFLAIKGGVDAASVWRDRRASGKAGEAPVREHSTEEIGQMMSEHIPELPGLETGQIYEVTLQEGGRPLYTADASRAIYDYRKFGGDGRSIKAVNAAESPKDVIAPGSPLKERSYLVERDIDPTKTMREALEDIGDRRLMAQAEHSGVNLDAPASHLSIVTTAKRGEGGEPMTLPQENRVIGSTAPGEYVVYHKGLGYEGTEAPPLPKQELLQRLQTVYRDIEKAKPGGEEYARLVSERDILEKQMVEVGKEVETAKAEARLKKINQTILRQPLTRKQLQRLISERGKLEETLQKQAVKEQPKAETSTPAEEKAPTAEVEKKPSFEISTKKVRIRDKFGKTKRNKELLEVRFPGEVPANVDAGLRAEKFFYNANENVYRLSETLTKATSKEAVSDLVSGLLGEKVVERPKVESKGKNAATPPDEFKGQSIRDLEKQMREFYPDTDVSAVRQAIKEKVGDQREANRVYRETLKVTLRTLRKEPAPSVELPKVPDRVNTGNSAADAARDLAHQKSALGVARQAEDLFRDKDPSKFAEAQRVAKQLEKEIAASEKRFRSEQDKLIEQASAAAPQPVREARVRLNPEPALKVKRTSKFEQSLPEPERARIVDRSEKVATPMAHPNRSMSVYTVFQQSANLGRQAGFPLSSAQWKSVADAIPEAKPLIDKITTGTNMGELEFLETMDATLNTKGVKEQLTNLTAKRGGARQRGLIENFHQSIQNTARLLGHRRTYEKAVQDIWQQEGDATRAILSELEERSKFITQELDVLDANRKLLGEENPALDLYRSKKAESADLILKEIDALKKKVGTKKFAKSEELRKLNDELRGLDETADPKRAAELREEIEKLNSSIRSDASSDHLRNYMRRVGDEAIKREEARKKALRGTGLGPLQPDILGKIYRREKTALPYTTDMVIRRSPFSQFVSETGIAKAAPNFREWFRSILPSLMEKGRKLKEPFTTFPLLKKKETAEFYQPAVELLRLSFDDRARAVREARVAATEVVSGLDFKQYELFRQKVVLENMIDDASRGLPVARGFDLQELLREKMAIDDLIDLDPAVREAVKADRDLWSSVAEDLIARQRIDASVRDRPYFSKYVLDFIKDKYWTRKPLYKRPVGDYQRARKGSLRDYETDYVAVTSHRLAEIFEDNLIEDKITSVMRLYDVKKTLPADPYTGRVEVPDGYSIIYLDQGRFSKSAQTPLDAIVTDIIDQTIAALPEDIPTVAQLPRGEIYVVPSDLAQTLQTMKAKYFPKPIPILTPAVQGFKRLVIGIRPISYNRRNAIGDTNRLLAAAPEIMTPDFFKTTARVVHDLRRAKRGDMSPDLQLAYDHGVTSAGPVFQETKMTDIGSFTSADVGIRPPDFYKKHPQALVSDAAHFYDRNINGFTEFREQIWYVTTFYKNLNRIREGKPIFTGISDVSGLLDWSKSLEAAGQHDLAFDMKVKAAAKVAREILTDYGDLTGFEKKYLRNAMLPFYTWQKSNLLFWPKLLNTRGLKATAKFGATKGAAIAGYTITASIGSYAAAQVWNNLMYGNIEEQQSEMDRRRFHVILPMKNDEGEQMIFNDPTAFSDFLETLGLDALTLDITEMLKGNLSPQDVAAAYPEHLAVAALRKTISLANPYLVGMASAIFRRQLWPDPTKPRPVYDEAWKIFARSLGYGPAVSLVEYTGLSEGYTTDMQNLVRDISPITPEFYENWDPDKITVNPALFGVEAFDSDKAALIAVNYLANKAKQDAGYEADSGSGPYTKYHSAIFRALVNKQPSMARRAFEDMLDKDGGKISDGAIKFLDYAMRRNPLRFGKPQEDGTPSSLFPGIPQVANKEGEHYSPKSQLASSLTPVQREQIARVNVLIGRVLEDYKNMVEEYQRKASP